MAHYEGVVYPNDVEEQIYVNDIQKDYLNAKHLDIVRPSIQEQPRYVSSAFANPSILQQTAKSPQQTDRPAYHQASTNDINVSVKQSIPTSCSSEGTVKKLIDFL